MLPQLRELERRHPGELAVIGVHSAKFMAEKATENLRDAVVRYGVDHPVVNDRDFAVWNDYAVRAWPTLLFIDPQGKLIAKHEGEAPLAALDRFVTQALDEYRAQGLLDTSRPLPVRREEVSEAGLAFPGKLAIDPRGERLAVSDTNHDRVLVATLDGRVERVVAGFTRPQGVAFGEGRLFVADTGDHSVCAVDLATGAVTRLAGTGEAAMTSDALEEGGLRSPWDVCWLEGWLYIAMAGAHQVWRMRAGEDPVRPEPWAGSGREGIQDGGLRDAWLAQPSGLATDGRLLYVADSEVSAVREIDPRAGTVRTLVGEGLFEFGDRDGEAGSARLQHPLGVAAAPDAVYVADTYNGKLKRVDLAARQVATVAAGFNEPSGLALAGQRLYVADTNQHRIAVVELPGGEVSDLRLTGL
jgi:sugar lactone lactonase YvrE